MLTFQAMTVAVLSTINSPLLAPFLVAMGDEGITDFVVILDRKVEADKDLAIWQQRTKGYFADKLGNKGDPYGFEDRAPPFFLVTNHNSEASVALIRKLGIKVLANAGTPRRLGAAVLNATPHGVVNVHPGILPKYRGCSCVEWAIYNDDPVGNTAHFMSEGYDEGPIIATEAYEFPAGADYPAIRSMTYERGFALMAKSIKKILETGMTAKDATTQEGGQSWKPIPDEKMQEVLLKIAERRYRYAAG